MKWQRKNARPIRIEGAIAYITLTMGNVAVIDATDAHLFEGWNWQAHKARDGKFYARRNSKDADGKRNKIYVHRVISGTTPEGYVTHHDDGDGLNNRRSNLLVITKLENIVLSNKKHTRHRYRGRKVRAGSAATIRFIKRYASWSVQLGLGQYKTEAEAIEAKAWIDRIITQARSAEKRAA